MDDFYKFYQEFCYKQLQTWHYVPEYYEWLQWYRLVPQTTNNTVINQEELNSVEDSEKPIKCEKKKELAKYGGKKTRKTMHK